MGIPSLQDFSLVGGTALALKYGHRVSVDLDLFSDRDLESSSILHDLKKEFGERFQYEGGDLKWAIFCYINNIKTDIVHYPHKLIAAVEVTEGIRMYGDADIAAMKINAILGRGKKKDFWDLYELLLRYSLPEIIHWHSMKFPNQMLLISIPQAITYFADADEDENPISLKNQSWDHVKSFIQQKVNEYLK